MHADFNKMTKRFLMNEGTEPTLMEYLNVMEEMLNNFKPSRVSESSKISVMKENIRRARRHARIMEERLKLLEEQVKIIEEAKHSKENKDDKDEKPLTPEETKKLQKANVYVMDFECDGGTLPDWIDKMMHADYDATNSEYRKLLKWFYHNAPGDY